MRRSSVVIAVLVVVAVHRPIGQVNSAFTAEDMLKVATASVLDLAEDGSRAVAIRTLESNATTDHRRFGDPTYVAPSLVDVMVCDTRQPRRQSLQRADERQTGGMDARWVASRAAHDRRERRTIAGHDRMDLGCHQPNTHRGAATAREWHRIDIGINVVARWIEARRRDSRSR